MSLKSISKKTTVQLYKNQIRRNNPLAIIDQVDYLQSILSDSSKFAEVFVADEKQPDILVNLEKQITDLKKQLKDSQVNSDTDYNIKKLKPRGSRFDKLDTLFKMLKNLIFH